MQKAMHVTCPKPKKAATERYIGGRVETYGLWDICTVRDIKKKKMSWTQYIRAQNPPQLNGLHSHASFCFLLFWSHESCILDCPIDHLQQKGWRYFPSDWLVANSLGNWKTIFEFSQPERSLNFGLWFFGDWTNH